MGGSPRQWLGRFPRDKHISKKDRAAHELRCLCNVLEEAACFDQLNLGALAYPEVTARRLNLIVDAHKQGGAPSNVNAKYLTPLAGTGEILARRSPSPPVETNTRRLGSDAKREESGRSRGNDRPHDVR